MAIKEGVFSFTVYCDLDYWEKVKNAASENEQKISAFVIEVCDKHLYDGLLATFFISLPDLFSRSVSVGKSDKYVI